MPGPHDVEGIGLSQIWPILDRSLIDEVITVADDDAFATCRDARARGGPLRRAAPRARRPPPRSQIARRLGPGKTVVTLFPDGAERYPEQGIFEKAEWRIES